MQKYKNPELVTVRAELCAKTEYKSKSTNIKIENLRVWEVFARSKSRNCSICLRLGFPLESLHEKTWEYMRLGGTFSLFGIHS